MLVALTLTSLLDLKQSNKVEVQGMCMLKIQVKELCVPVARQGGYMEALSQR